MPMSAVTSQAETPALAADARIEAEHQMHAQQVQHSASMESGTESGREGAGCNGTAAGFITDRAQDIHEPRSVAGGAGTAGVPGPAM